jgi:5-methylcytosine-specific restriction endonuclease McrA
MKAAGHAVLQLCGTADAAQGRMVSAVGWQEEFYKSARWLHKREQILRRDKYLCTECRRYGRRDRDGLPVQAVTVHHIEPLELAPERKLDDKNLQSLCKACHNRKHPEKGTPPSRRRGNPRLP